MKDFFISYNSNDRAWAEWIAWQLEEAGYTVLIQAWDFLDIGNFILAMQKGTADCERTIAVISPNYFGSDWTAAEWTAIVAKDPTAANGLLIPVRVEKFDPPGLFASRTYVDFASNGVSEEIARDRLLTRVKGGRQKPHHKPAFPGAPARVIKREPSFPSGGPQRMRSVPHLKNPNFTREDSTGARGRRTAAGKSIEIFYSYSHEDEDLRDKLEKHLSILKRNGHISNWHDRRIGAGTEWRGQIDVHLESAGIILLLISSSFLASDYCYDVEMDRALVRHRAGIARVIPVILRHVLWEGAPFANLQALPTDAQPVQSRHWTNEDEAFLDIARGIQRAANEMGSGLTGGITANPGTNSPAGLASRIKKVSARPEKFDLFLAYVGEDKEWVEALAQRLETEHDFRVWLDQWGVPDGSWRGAIDQGLADASTCAVCIGGQSPSEWFQNEVESALHYQARKAEFRVIPVLLPDASEGIVSGFRELNTWVDFRHGRDLEFAFHVLSQGIRGEPVGDWPTPQGDRTTTAREITEQRLKELTTLRPHLHEQIVIEFQRKILQRWLEEGGGG